MRIRTSSWCVAAVVAVAMIGGLALEAEARISKELKEELQPRVEKGLSSDDPLVKGYAIQAAGVLADRELDKQLALFLENTNTGVRRAAIVALASRKDRKGLAALEQEIIKAGGGAAFTLGELVPALPENVQFDVLKGWITGRNVDAKLRDAALGYTARFGRDKVYGLMAGVTTARTEAERKPFLDKLIANPREDALPWAEKLLGNRRDADARLGGLRLTMAIGGPKVDPIIRKALTDDDERIAGIALDYLAEAGDASAGEFLAKALPRAKDKLGIAEQILALRVKVPLSVAQQALKDAGEEGPLVDVLHGVLGATQDPKAVETLLNLEQSTVIGERRLGVLGLGYTNSPKAADVLERTLFDGNDEIKRISAAALGTLGMARSVDVLYKAFNNARSDKEMRYAIVKSMGQIKDAKAAQKLTFWIRDNDAQIKALAIEGLAFIGDKDSIALLRTVVSNERDAELKFNSFMIMLKADKAFALTQLDAVIQRPPEDYIDRFSALPRELRAEVFGLLLKNKEKKTREDAFDGLMAMGEQGLPLIRQAATDKGAAPDIHEASILELARHTAPEDVNLFKRLAQTGTEDERILAFTWLIRVADESMTGFFRTQMNGAKDDLARQMAAVYAILKANA